MILVLTNSIVVQKPDDFFGYLLVALLVFVLVGLVGAVNLTVGQCVTDVNSSIQYCAPANLASQTVQFAYPSFGVSERLNYSCGSGELVRNALPPFQNQFVNLSSNQTNASFVPYFNFTVYCQANNVTVLNDTVYVNNTVVEKPKLDLDETLAFGGKYWNYDMNLSIACPEFPKINDIWQLAPAEKKKVDEYNLIVSCANSSEMCPICTPKENIVNIENCTNSTIEPVSMQACVNAGFSSVPTPIPQQLLIPSDYNWIIILIGLVGGGFLLNSYLKNQPKKEEVK